MMMTKSKAPPLRNPEVRHREVIHQDVMHQEVVDDISAASIPVRDDEQEFFSDGQNQTMYDRYPGSQEMHY